MSKEESKETTLIKIYLQERMIVYIQEHYFHKQYCKDNNLSIKPRQYHFDLAIPSLMIALEIEGGIWTQGRHIRPLGFINDCIKYNLATMCGWAVYRLPTCFFEGNSKYYPHLIKVLGSIIN